MGREDVLWKDNMPQPKQLAEDVPEAGEEGTPDPADAITADPGGARTLPGLPGPSAMTQAPHHTGMMVGGSSGRGGRIRGVGRAACARAAGAGPLSASSATTGRHGCLTSAADAAATAPGQDGAGATLHRACGPPCAKEGTRVGPALAGAAGPRAIAGAAADSWRALAGPAAESG
jgi:hypothetical protein